MILIAAICWLIGFAVAAKYDLLSIFAAIHIGVFLAAC